MAKKRSGSNAKKYILLFIVLALIVGVVLYFKAHEHKLNTKGNNAVGVKTVAKGTTSKPTQHQVSNNNSVVQGGIVDNNGQTTGILPPSSQWISSTSGNITLQKPLSRYTVKSGDTISGLATVNEVQFILSDNAVGLIAQGNLNVVNGKFSGTLHFTSHSSSGKLEIYYPNPSTGAEEDIINIDVNFGT